MLIIILSLLIIVSPLLSWVDVSIFDYGILDYWYSYSGIEIIQEGSYDAYVPVFCVLFGIVNILLTFLHYKNYELPISRYVIIFLFGLFILVSCFDFFTVNTFVDSISTYVDMFVSVSSGFDLASFSALLITIFSIRKWYICRNNELKANGTYVPRFETNDYTVTHDAPNTDSIYSTETAGNFDSVYNETNDNLITSSANVRYCATCGTKNRSDSNYCVSCGRKLDFDLK